MLSFPFVCVHYLPGASQAALVVKNSPANTRDIRDVASVPGSRRSPGGGNGNPLQYSCLGNPMDKGVQWATVHDTSSVRHDLVTKEEQQEDRLAFVFCKSLELGLAIAGVNTYFSEKVVGYQEDTYCYIHYFNFVRDLVFLVTSNITFFFS